MGELVRGTVASRGCKVTLVLSAEAAMSELRSLVDPVLVMIHSDRGVTSSSWAERSASTRRQRRSGIRDGFGTICDPFSAHRYLDFEGELSHTTLARGVTRRG
jgi:hypothetical protein